MIVPALAENDVQLFVTAVPEAGLDAILPRVVPMLSGEEIEAVGRFVFERHRILYAVSHAFLRSILGAYLRCSPRALELMRGAQGRPELVDRALRFSLSHTAGLALIGVTRWMDLGVDVERIDSRRGDAELARTVFTEAELPARSDAAGFFEGWTLKESYLKARGIGLSLDLQQFSFTTSDPPRLVCSAEIDDSRVWRFVSFSPAAGYRAAAAVRVSGAEAGVRWQVSNLGDFLF